MADKSLQTLERGLDILLLCAAHEPGGLPLATVMERLNLARSTTYRLVKVLRDRGFLRSGGKPGQIELGYQLVHLGKIADARAELSAASLPVLQDLVDALGETAFVTVRSGWRALCLEQVESTRAIRLSYRKGQQLPLYAGASGKIVLAHMREREQEQVLSGQLQVFTDERFVEPDRIRRDLAAIRRQGYAITRGEIDPDASAICVPIVLWDGKFIGGLNIAGPTVRFPQGAEVRFIKHLQEAAVAIADRFEELVR